MTLWNKTNLYWSWMKKKFKFYLQIYSMHFRKGIHNFQSNSLILRKGWNIWKLIEAHCKKIVMLECDCKQVHVIKYYRVDTYNISRIKIIYYRKPLAKSQSENRTANTCTSLRIIAMCCLFSYSTFITNNIIKYHYIKLFLSFI